MISHEHKTIFVHIPKTAGESIALYFLEDLGLDWKRKSSLMMFHDFSAKQEPRNMTHLKAHQYLDYHFVSKHIFDDYFKFSFVRNPWSRVVSFYKYMSYNRVVSFKIFVSKLLPEFVALNNFFVAPQAEYIYDNNGDLLVDFVGRFESLQKDFDTVLGTLQLPQKTLPHFNKTIKKKGFKYLYVDYHKFRASKGLLRYYGRDKIDSPNYQDYYTQPLIDIVADIYHRDVELFGYTFEEG